MGASMITHICVGPLKLSKDAKLRKKAVKQAKTLIDAITRWEEKDERLQIPSNAEFLGKEAVRLMNKFGPDDLNDWAFLHGVDPEKAVQELFDLWSGKDLPTDANVREYKSHQHQPHVKLQILVAGDQTWGDEPDGEGYRICKQSSFLGLFYLYGIK